MLPLLPTSLPPLNVIVPLTTPSTIALILPESPLYAKLLNVADSVSVPALDVVILVTLDPTATLSSELLSV